MVATAFVLAPTAPAQAGKYLYLETAVNLDGRSEWFWTDRDIVYHQWASRAGIQPDSVVRPLSGQKISSGVGATHNNDGRLEIFGRGQDGQLWHNWQIWPGGDWYGWVPLSGQIQSHSYLGAWYDAGTSTIRVQVVGTDGYLHILRQLHPGCCWNTVWE
ncbi:hypothetical protein Ate02nite_65250 [Paractinoplanes tereljensis]|uniref:PLL-like beta propeller domain-containing protein n=2 Tax=Paractinoplanes tereljensis TaxID=571912 RepID=A0A919TX12_9ACTN|nr:hypothetical protein Ate02nite_65250 [Actinoplanes tereljensis]